MKVIAASALRWSCREVRIALQRLEQWLDDSSLGGPCAAAVERRAGVAPAPGIEQGVAGAGVEALHGPGRWQIGNVCDASEVEHDAMLARITEDRSMERRHQRRALAAGSDVTATKIGDNGNARQFCKTSRIGDLRSVSKLGAMSDRLPVEADGFDIVCLHSAATQNVRHRASSAVHQIIGGERCTVDLIAA